MNIFLKNKFGEDSKDVILNQKNYNIYLIIGKIALNINA